MKNDNKDSRYETIIDDDREGKEVTERTLHFLVTNKDTGETVHEFDTSCCVLSAINKENTSESINFCFTAATLKDILHLISSATEAVERLKDTDPIIKAMLVLEEASRGFHVDEDEVDEE